MDWGDVTSLIGALVVPFLSVLAAHHVASRHERKQEIMRLFVRLHEEIQEFKLALVAFEIADDKFIQVKQYVEALGSVSPEDTKMWDDRLERCSDEVKVKHDAWHRNVARMRGHNLAAALMLGGDSRKLCEALHTLIYADRKASKLSLVEWENTVVNPAIDRVQTQIAEIWVATSKWKLPWM